MSRVRVNQSQVDAWARDHNGPIARVLEDVARDVVIPDAQLALAQSYVPGELNPPPGPPKRRTGRLYASLEVLPAGLSAHLGGDSRATVYVAASAWGDDGYDYALWLRGGGHPSGESYVFLPDRDYYTYVVQT